MPYKLIIAFFLLNLAASSLGHTNAKGIDALNNALSTIQIIIKDRNEEKLGEIFDERSVINYRGTLYTGMDQIHHWYRKLIFEENVTEVEYQQYMTMSTELSEANADGFVNLNLLQLKITLRVVLNENHYFMVENMQMTDIQPS
ncbi:unnamed protein product [Caenorhabditis auriculariae]|uniref:Nuclear transport factor 2 family protein n=1 Tax=Caenorhabditis auriculariae TaxID=2777116 RepID=A0A8S1H3G7_9PELO|nr:unnamed protein product [Caenorhabditis auriculariae]